MATTILDELAWRGLVAQSTDIDALAAAAAVPPMTVYAGFDPTAPSLHAGNLVPLLTLQRFQRAGHRPIVLAGGATGLIGDPRDSGERTMNTADTVAAWSERIRGQLERFVDFDSSATGAIVENNLTWTAPLGAIEFLRDVGKHFSVNVMLDRDTIRRRLDGEGISYTEFSYMLLQAWDFVHLSDALDCRVQIGGSDQWGNITAGIELGRRLRSRDLHGITCPLLTKSDGTKMGKTAAGAVWLDPHRTSPYRFYQYWINLDDDDAGRCVERLTELSLDEIRSLADLRGSNPAARDTQKRLAEELTRLVHGDAGLGIARQATAIFFGAEIGGLDDAALAEIFADVPSREFPRGTLEGEGLPLIEALEATGLAPTRSAARRTIEQGGAYVNNRRIADVAHRLTAGDLAGGSTLVLRSGKKSYAIARFL